MSKRPLAEQLKRLQKSYAWEVIERDIKARREAELDKLLKQASDYPSVCVHRGFIQALDWLLGDLIAGLIADAPAIEAGLDYSDEQPEETPQD